VLGLFLELRDPDIVKVMAFEAVFGRPAEMWVELEHLEAKLL